MPLPWTLQRYIFREMGKTFLLSSIALTGVIGLGGGVLNMLRLGEVTPAQLVRLMTLLLPLAAGLTLPIAALFAAAATYGRLSADNEFVACRSGGINMHVLFLPTVVLSLAAAGLSFGLTNYLIPVMVRELEEFITADVGQLIRQRLNRPRGITLGGRYRIRADRCVIDPSDPNRVALGHITFVEVDGGEWVRFGTAREVHLLFQRDEARLRVAGRMAGLSYYDRKLGQFFEEAEQILDVADIPSPIPGKTKFLTLNELLHYLNSPDKWHEVRRRIGRLRMAAGRRMAYDAIWKDWEDDHALELKDNEARLTLRSENPWRVPGGRGIEFSDVVVEEERPGRQRSFTARRASVEVTHGDTLEDGGLRIELRDARTSDGTAVIERTKVVLGPIAIPPEIVTRVESLSTEELLDPSYAKADGSLAELQKGVREALGETVRRVVGAVNERASFSVSVLVLVVLAAALGIIFRGSHMMTAFGVSFIPLLVVIVAIVTGRQMSHNATTHEVGILVMWSGIMGVAGLDAWILTRVLRR